MFVDDGKWRIVPRLREGEGQLGQPVVGPQVAGLAEQDLGRRRVVDDVVPHRKREAVDLQCDEYDEEGRDCRQQAAQRARQRANRGVLFLLHSLLLVSGHRRATLQDASARVEAFRMRAGEPTLSAAAFGYAQILGFPGDIAARLHLICLGYLRSRAIVGCKRADQQ